MLSFALRASAGADRALEDEGQEFTLFAPDDRAFAKVQGFFKKSKFWGLNVRHKHLILFFWSQGRKMALCISEQ